MAILFIDIDQFKHINDTYGHAGGDCVLKTMAQRIHQTIRKRDWAARIGGDEMLVVLYGLRAPRIISKSQRLCSHEKAAKEAAEKENAISTIGKISQALGGPPQDLCNHCRVTRALEITKEVECQVLEAPPSLVSF